jgi:serine/threonine protein kinase
MQKDIPKAEKASIIFQLFHAVYCLQLHRITHADIHANNILVEELDVPICFRYIVGSNQVTFNTKYIIKVFDFDLSNAQNVGLNPVYKGEEGEKRVIESNNPQIFREDRDFYQILCTFLGRTQYKDLILELLPSKVLTHEKMSYAGDKAFNMTLTKNSKDKIEKETPINDVHNHKRKSYLIPIDRLKIILTPVEFKRIQENVPKIDIMSMLFFTVYDGRMNIGKGWHCQMLHILSRDHYYPLKEYFMSKRLFDMLTKHLDKGGKPDEIFTTF